MDFEPARDLPPGWKPDIIWASPPCQAFSVANLWNNWSNGRPKSEKVKAAILILEKTISIIKELQPTYYFIENPRGMMRTLNLMRRFPRRTITYCRYGLPYQKPTDIWSNCITWISRKPCRAGHGCHEASPRGSKAGGIQKLNNAFERGKLPLELCREILKAVSARPGPYQSTLL
jgi:hypothetical protein